MNFADEAYIRLYLRDTINWKMLNWQAKCVWPLLARKLDRAGVLDLGEFSGELARVVSALIEIPEEIVVEGLAALAKQKTIVLNGQYLVAPNFIEAQEATQNDKTRKAEWRARHRDKSLAIARGLLPPPIENPPTADPPNGGGAVTNPDRMSQHGVPKSDEPSQNGTKCPPTPDRSHSSRAELSLAELSRAEPAGTTAAASQDDTQVWATAIEERLRRHGSLFSSLNLRRIAQQHAGFMALAPENKLHLVLDAIDVCAAKMPDGLNVEAKQSKLVGFMRNAHVYAAGKMNGANGHHRKKSDAVIESKEQTAAERAAVIQQQNARRAAAEVERLKRAKLEEKAK